MNIAVKFDIILFIVYDCFTSLIAVFCMKKMIFEAHFVLDDAFNNIDFKKYFRF